MRVARLASRLTFLVAAGVAAHVQARSELTYEALMAGSYPVTVRLQAFTPDETAAAPTQRFEGSLRLRGQPQSRTVERDAAFAGEADEAVARTLPQDFDYDFVQDGAALVPVRRGPQPSTHGWWEFILEPGRAWDEPGDHGYSRAVIPFALQEKNANCTHNGLLTFLFKSDGSVSRAALQVSGETCAYLKLDLWGMLTASYRPRAVAGKAQTLTRYRQEVAHRLPVQTLAQLAAAYPRLDVGNLAIGADGGRTLYGLVVHGVNYVSGCRTRAGDYPFCDVLDLPSYSTAKSVFAALALMRLQALTHAAPAQMIRSWAQAPECQTAAWEGVTFGDALNMSTGNYDSAAYEADENAAKSAGLFLALSHQEKIAFGCGAYPRHSPPGTLWVYHTSDTYVLGTALSAYFQSIPGQAGRDFFSELLVKPIFEPLGLSPVLSYTRRTYDSVAQPFTGWGLTYHRDDIARLGQFLTTDDGRIAGVAVLDAAMLASALQRNPADRGLPVAQLGEYRYKNGFWARNVQRLLGCAKATWIPFMSGFGGISVVLFPDGSVYYNFADDGLVASFDWGKAALELQKLGSLCSDNGT
jgi:hypothetical protein